MDTETLCGQESQESWSSYINSLKADVPNNRFEADDAKPDSREKKKRRHGLRFRDRSTEKRRALGGLRNTAPRLAPLTQASQSFTD